MTPKLRNAAFAAMRRVLVGSPAMAEVYTIQLNNGTSFQSRYQPREAPWDADKIAFIDEIGTWVSLTRPTSPASPPTANRAATAR